MGKTDKTEMHCSFDRVVETGQPKMGSLRGIPGCRGVKVELRFSEVGIDRS